MKYRYVLVLLAYYWSINAYSNYCANYSLFDKKILSTDGIALIEADLSSVENKNIYSLKGNASVISPDYALRADQITINKELKSASSSGNVKFNDQNALLTSQNLEITKKENSNFIKANSAEYALPDQNIRGSAATLSGTSDLKTFNNATYTKCPVGNLNWNIDAESIVLNSKTNRGKAENAFLKLHGVPVVYTPSVEWVLNGKGSGFLAPSYSSYSDDGTSKKGYSVNVPYFLNIAPDRDILLGLNHLSTRGENLTAIYRQLIYDNSFWNKGRLETEVRYLENDDVSNKNRWLLDNKLNLSLNTNTNLTIQNTRVSDKDYFKEIALEGTSRERLISAININHQHDLFNTNFYSEAEQVVNSGGNNYTKALDLNLSKVFTLNSIKFGLNNTSTSFKHKNPTNTEVFRNNSDIKISYIFKKLAYEITPTLSLINTNYQFDNLPNHNRFIYSSNITSKLFFEREFKIFDDDYVQTLVPILQYSYTPKKNQNLIPNFDTESIEDDNFEAFFSASSFVGSDKISNQNNFTLGIESEFINDNSGDTVLTLKAAQKFYVDDQIMNSSGSFVQSAESSRGYSDINSSLELNLPFITIEGNVNFNPSNMSSGNTRTSLNIRGDGRNILKLSYLDHDSTQSASLTSIYDLNETDHLFLRVDRNLSSKLTNKNTIGFTKDDCCLAFRFAFFKNHISSNKYNYERVFELVFKGLSSTTPSLKQRIEAEIPDYIGDLVNNL